MIYIAVPKPDLVWQIALNVASDFFLSILLDAEQYKMTSYRQLFKNSKGFLEILSYLTSL